MKATDTMYEGDLWDFALLDQWDHSVGFDMPCCAVRLKRSKFSDIFLLVSKQQRRATFDLFRINNLRYGTVSMKPLGFTVIRIHTYIYKHTTPKQNFKNSF